jgi:hypothetical protein
MNKGVVWGIVPFIATIAVPHRKKGAISKRGANRSLDSVSLNGIADPEMNASLLILSKY